MRPASDRNAVPHTADREIPAFPASILEEQPLVLRLCASIRDAVFASSLPPLELTSVPVPASDPMAFRTNPWSVGMSVLVNGGILALLLVFGLKAKLAPVTNPSPAGNFKLSDLTLFAPSSAETAHGGGGGGSHDLIDPITGRLPKFSPTPIVPPMVPQVDHPRLVIDSAIAVPPEINLPDNPNLPNLGVYHSANVTLTSGGPGSAGIGTGFNGGVGPDSGNGAGPGYDHGAGGSIYTPDVGGVTAPIPTFTPEADFSEEARRAKYQGVCMISVIVDTHGNPVNPLVVRPLGMGLDEKALDAVRKYRFKPARKDGRPVPVMILVAVNFRLY